MAVELGTLDGAIALTTATDEWSRDVEVLLSERAARTQRARLDVELPTAAVGKPTRHLAPRPR